MRPQLQLRKSADGDCLRAVIASLLDYDINQVPDFTGQGDSIDWWLSMQEWLMERGLFFLEVRIGGTLKVRVPMDAEREKALDMEPGTMTEEVDKEIFTVWNPMPFPAIAMLIGWTKSGHRHIIIGLADGPQFIPQFDPFPESGGITSVEAVGFLVQRDPSIGIKMGRALEKVVKLATTRIEGAPLSHEIAGSIRATAREALGMEESHAVVANGNVIRFNG